MNPLLRCLALCTLVQFAAQGAEPAGKMLKLHDQGVTVELRAPAGWKVISSADEPLDWQFAVTAPDEKREFGIRLEANAAPKKYLSEIHHLYDPKIKMTPEPPLHLADGRSITPYRCSSSYWKERLLVIVPEGKTATILEFTAPDRAAFAKSRPLIEQIFASYSSHH